MIRTARDLWSGRARLWALALAFFLLAAAALGVYRLRFAGEAEASEGSLTRGRQALAALTRDRETLERDLRRVRANREMLAAFYSQRLATESERLTRIIAEVKDLASRAGMLPQEISYPDTQIESFGLRRRGFVFGVEGRYADLRRLLNLLELSQSFLTLEEVTLREGGGGGTLRIDLSLSTLFADPDADPLDGAGPAQAAAGGRRRAEPARPAEPEEEPSPGGRRPTPEALAEEGV